MYNTTADDLARIAKDLGQISSKYTAGSLELDQHITSLDNTASHLLYGGAKPWVGLASEAFQGAWAERRSRMQQASQLLTQAAQHLTQFAQTIDEYLPQIRMDQQLMQGPTSHMLAPDDQSSILSGESQAQNAILMALQTLNSQLEELAYEVRDCPEEQDESSPAWGDPYDNINRSESNAGGGNDDSSNTGESGDSQNPYTGSNGENPDDLIKQLRDSGKKFSEKDIVGITHTPSGKIVWLEEGNSSAGLEHIMDGDGTPGDKGHAADFANIGVNGEENVTKLIIDTLQDETPVGKTPTGGSIYNVQVNGVSRQIVIVVGSNGFVVTAFPI